MPQYNPHGEPVAAQRAGRGGVRGKAFENTYLSAQFARIAARRGIKKAAVAVAHSILVIVYHLLNDRHDYLDLGPTYFDHRERSRITRRLQTRPERPGYRVQRERIPSAA